MREVKDSADGKCPDCLSDQWRLAKVVVMEGTQVVDTTSTGDWLDDTDFKTKGKQTTVAADRHGPPVVPQNYHRKQEWLSGCREALADADRERHKIDDFATTTTSLRTGFLSNKCDTGLHEAESRFKNYARSLLVLLKYEEQRALWERTRVCGRCGQEYVICEDRRSVKASFEIPTFSFSRQHEHCPKCGTYQWKTADAYFAILMRSAESDLNRQRELLKKAEEYAKDPHPSGFWERIKRAVSEVPPPEKVAE